MRRSREIAGCDQRLLDLGKEWEADARSPATMADPAALSLQHRSDSRKGQTIHIHESVIQPTRAKDLAAQAQELPQPVRTH